MCADWQPNYDEALVPSCSLPDPLVCVNGDDVRTAATWESVRRPELVKLFEEHVYGLMPGRPERLHWRVLDDALAINGLAHRRQVRVFLSAGEADPYFDILLYVPAARSGPVSTFLGLNFRGNHTIHADRGILLNTHWIQNDEVCCVTGHRACEASRGTRARRWPVERILSRGYGLATVYYGDIDPDYDDGFANGVHPLFGQMGVPRESLSSISAWAWGLRRALDYLETDPAVDGDRVAVMGHSRLGKTALWAGALDSRFHLVISNDSGCGGAALSRRCFGETVWAITSAVPYWFCAKFREYDNREVELPVDQHELIALCAPRPVYVASAANDRWADPKGEFLSVCYAAPVYALYGVDGLHFAKYPSLHKPVGDLVCYHIRAGDHDVTDYDWDCFMDLADRAKSLTHLQTCHPCRAQPEEDESPH